MGSDCLTVPYSLSRLLWKLASCQVPKQAYPFCVAMGLAMLSTPQSRGPGMAFPDLLVSIKSCSFPLNFF